MPTLDKTSAALESFFRDLHTRWLELAPDQMVITDERLRQELALPRGTPTRICYFSLPTVLVSFYRDSVFPLADHAGLVPATGDETLGKGGTLRAMIDMLLDRAALVVTDVSTGDARVRRELRAARHGARTAAQIAVISEEPATTNESSTDTPIIIRRAPMMPILGVQGTPELPDPTAWLHQLAAWLEQAGRVATSNLDADAKGLLERGSHHAAVIKAMSALEVALRDAVERKPRTARAISRLPSGSHLSVLLDEAQHRGILKPAELEQLREVQRVRNALVHSPQDIPANEARQLVEPTLAVVKGLKAPGSKAQSRARR